jgi:hypothetical protein
VVEPRGSRLITDAQVRAKHAPGRKLSESCDGRGGGVLVVRWGTGDRRWYYFRYVGPQRRQHALPLNVDTLAQARAAARALANRAREARAQGNDLRALLDQEEAQRRREERDRLEAAALAARNAERGTLRALLSAYVAYLERAGKQAAGDARRLFERHVYGRHAELASRQAAAITPDDVTAVVREVVDLGHGRTAAKLRSYLRSAFALAIRAPLDASAPAALVGLGVKSNPAAATAALAEFNGVRDRVLTDAELGHYAHALTAAAPSPARDALLVALLAGGQRPTQLLRCVRGDADLAAGTLTLRDGKGRRKVPRLHVLPLAPSALALVAARCAGASDAPLFSADDKRSTRIETCEEFSGAILSGMASDERLREAKALGTGRAQLRDLRRTCETMLAALGVPRDIRAQIQSHGLGGVQDRHYDRHSYRDEKRDALARWEAHVLALVERHKDQAQQPAALAVGNVVAIGRARRRRGA